MPNAKIALHPDLRRLALPESIRNVDLRFLEQAILEDSGLEPANVEFLLNQVYGRQGDESLPYLTVYEETPATSPAGNNVSRKSRQKRSNGRPHEIKPDSPTHNSFKVCCDLTASRFRVTRDFERLCAKKRREHLVPDPPRFRCRPDSFKRDLFVYVLRKDRLWTVANIDLQLGKMNLPKLADVWQPGEDKWRAGLTEAKAARRKIVYRISKLIERYYGIEVFVPAHVRAVANILQENGVPANFIAGILCAKDERRVLAQRRFK